MWSGRRRGAWGVGLVLMAVAGAGAFTADAAAQECRRWAGAPWAGAVAAGDVGPSVAMGERQPLRPVQPVAQDCAVQRERDGARVILQAGAWQAMCTEGRGCALPGMAVQGQRLQVSRQLSDDAWRIVLSLPVPADAGAGVRLSVDGGEAENLPSEFLQAQENGRVIAVRPEVADAVLDMLQGARRSVEWHYMTKAGEERRFALPAECMGEALRALRRQFAMMQAMQRMGR